MHVTDEEVSASSGCLEDYSKRNAQPGSKSDGGCARPEKVREKWRETLDIGSARQGTGPSNAVE
ncbi:MAG: hypothetical protein M1819_004899 [Sarea resinae]|nr:MAG: hypothetical protein M1819_004899 [Sarea resinae]